MGAYCHFILIALSDFRYNIALFDFIILPNFATNDTRLMFTYSIAALNKRINLKVVKLS